MRDALIHFLDRIKDYEHESGHSMHEDERESYEIVDIHLEAVPELKNYVSISHVSVSLFNEALRVMRDLAEHQNGTPLIRHEEEYNKTMTEVWDFLEANET